VLGSIGPGTKLPTLGHVTFRELRDSYYQNAAGLLRGGADDVIGLNCATGPDLMSEHLRYLAANSPIPISCQPNAGLDRAKVARLLEPERIGVDLSEEMQLHPEQSTDALVVHHPAAHYFSV
jgi:methionine synthase I (cobalamin-dependent)